MAKRSVHGMYQAHMSGRHGVPRAALSQSARLSLQQRSAVDHKRMLQNELGAEFSKYFDLLKQFIACKLTKVEFDNQVSAYINTQQRGTIWRFFSAVTRFTVVNLHNFFMLSILRGAYDQVALSKRRPKRVNRFMPRMRSTLLGRQKEKDKTEYAELRRRFEAAAQKSGLKVAPEVVGYAMKALESYISQHLSACATTSMVGGGSGLVGFGSSYEEQLNSQMPGYITAETLRGALYKRPHSQSELTDMLLECINFAA